jgi:anti-sigma factor RsiW
MTNAQGAAPPMDEPLLLVHAYLDGELDPANSLAIAQQIAADPALGAEVEHIQAVRHAVHERFPRELLPPHLRARIGAVIGRRGLQVHPSWRTPAASVVVAMATADATGRTKREKIIKANPFLERFTVADLRNWADRKMHVPGP